MMKRDIQSATRAVQTLKTSIRSLLRNPLLQPGLHVALLQLDKELVVARSFWRHAERSLDIARSRSLPDCLQIGGGKQYLAGFVNLDVLPSADIVWDCRYGLPFRSTQFSFVFSEHFLEHLDYPVSVERLLRELYRVLRPGGETLIGVPDGGKAVDAHVKKKRAFLKKLEQRCYARRNPRLTVHGTFDMVNYLFRDQVENPKYAVHWWSYDAASLGKLLRSVGFRQVQRASFNARYCNPKREFYTLYMKAVK